MSEFKRLTLQEFKELKFYVECWNALKAAYAELDKLDESEKRWAESAIRLESENVRLKVRIIELDQMEKRIVQP